MKKVIIFGSSSGMAEAYARLMAKKSFHLFLVARNQEKLDIQKSDLLVRGASAVDTYCLDFLNLDQQKQIVDEIFSKHQIDHCLLAQGNMFEQKEAELKPALSKSMIDINLTSVVGICNACIPHFEKQKSGQIAVISSVAGDRGRSSNFIYASTKAGVQAYLSGLRARLFSFSVNVLDIRPGFVSTAMTAQLPQGPLFVKPESIALGIDKALKSRKSVVYLPFFWYWIMLIIRNLPGFVFNRMKF